MKQIADSVLFIPGQDEMIPDSHTYIVGKLSSKDLSLIDPGLMGKAEYKIDAVIKAGIALPDIKRIILTHTHLDHMGCLPDVKEKIPHAELWVHKNEGEPMEQGDDRTIYGMEMFKTMCQAQFNLGPDAFNLHVDRKLEGGQNLTVGGTAWEVMHIPGHSIGGIALYNREDKILIPGDVIYADSAIGRFDLFGANGAHLKESLLALSQLDVEILLPGHNRIMEAVPTGYILNTAKQWEPYLT